MRSCPNTSSPGENRFAPSPSASTTPATSAPRTIGNVPGICSFIQPSTMRRSIGFMEAAWTLISSCPGPAFGLGSSVTTGLPPYSETATARISANREDAVHPCGGMSGHGAEVVEPAALPERDDQPGGLARLDIRGPPAADVKVVGHVTGIPDRERDPARPRDGLRLELEGELLGADPVLRRARPRLRFAACRGHLGECVGNELEPRPPVEPGRAGADEQRVAVDRGEGVDAGGRRGGPERLPGLRVEGGDLARVRAREDDVVRDRGGAEVERRQLPLPEHLAGGGVDGGEAATALAEVGALAREPPPQACLPGPRGENDPRDEKK